MYCNHCGTNLPQGAAFCPECGKPAPKTTMAPNPKKPSPKRKGLIIGSIFVVMLVIAAICLFFFIPGFGKKSADNSETNTKETSTASESLEEYTDKPSNKETINSETSAVPDETTISTPSEPVITISLDTITIGEDIAVEYPIIHSEKYKDVADSLNEEWLILAEETAADFKQEMATTENAFIKVSFNEPYIDGSRISLVQSTSAYTGGAHPMTYLKAYNLDLNGPTELAPENWLECESALAIESAVLAGTRMEAVTTGEVALEQVRETLGSQNNFVYYMAADGLHIRFQLYSLSSYHIGMPELIITDMDVTTARNILSNGKQVETGAAPQNTEAATTATDPTYTSGSGGVTAPNAPFGTAVEVYYGLTADTGDFLYPYSSTKLLTDEDLKKLEAATVEQMHSNSQLAINEILARYGYAFKPDSSDTAREVWERFCNLTWYQKAMEYCSYTKGSQVLEAMNEIEKANVDKINQWQKDHGCYY